jgi:SAM-dependent methyltransferase
MVEGRSHFWNGARCRTWEWVMKKQENKFSHLTAIERISLSFPAKFLLDKNLLKGKILDFGCGFGNDVKLLEKKGLRDYGL